MSRRYQWPLFIGFALLTVPVQAREWTDASGKYTQQADLVDFDDQTAILKKADGRLVAVPLAKLSKKDLDFLKSKDATEAVDQEASDDRTWTLADGKTVKGKVLDYGLAELRLERVAGLVRVSFSGASGREQVDRKPFEKMTKLHQALVPQIVNHFEHTTIKNVDDLDKLLAKRQVEQRQYKLEYKLEGVVLELDNGEKFAVPFFAFSDRDQKILKPGWKDWEAAAEEKQKKQQASLFLRAKANAYQRDHNETRQIMMLQLESQWFDLWQVGLARGGESTTVIVPGRNSEQAAEQALAKYPGATVIGIAKLQRRTY